MLLHRFVKFILLRYEGTKSECSIGFLRKNLINKAKKTIQLNVILSDNF